MSTNAAAAGIGSGATSPSAAASPADDTAELDPIVVEDVSLAYGTRRVYDKLSCRFPRGHISVILGGSGVGKSTLLHMAGGLIRPDSGAVRVDGQDVTQLSERALYDVRRKLGMLFQGGALLDSYSVFENVALPLREQTRLKEQQIADEVHASLEAVGLSDVDDLLPGELSGGMLRRAALARAIIRKPSILLCDEPFSGLDPVSVKRIESLLVGINRLTHMTMIIVSHDIPSTLRMADRVLLMLGDRTVEGTPDDLRKIGDPVVLEYMNHGDEHTRD